MKHYKLVKNPLNLLLLFVAIFLLIIYAPVTNSQDERADFQFESLQTALIDYGFVVKLEIPPYQNKYGIKPYGLLEGKTKTIWINPVVFDLGNAKPTLIHEATHAAQLCAGEGNFELLNLDIDPPRITHPYFMRYHNYRKEIEAEAYTVQVQPNSLEIVDRLLDTHCLAKNN